MDSPNPYKKEKKVLDHFFIYILFLEEQPKTNF